MARIRHLAIVTANRERLVNFYTRAFGMRVIYGRPGRTHLSDGSFNLAIMDKRDDVKEGLYAIGFDIEPGNSMVQHFQAAGTATDLQPMPKDHDAEYRALDPDGNIVDLSVHGWPVV